MGGLKQVAILMHDDVLSFDDAYNVVRLRLDEKFYQRRVMRQEQAWVEARDKMTMKERCMSVARAYTPETVKIKYHRKLSGRVSDSFDEMVVPIPVTRRALFVFLQECAHYHSEDFEPSYLEEKEAAQWARNTMRKEGIAVPRVLHKNREKNNLLYRVVMALRRIINNFTFQFRYDEFLGVACIIGWRDKLKVLHAGIHDNTAAQVSTIRKK